MQIEKPTQIQAVARPSADPAPHPASAMSALPPDILEVIHSHLAPLDWVSAAGVSHEWRQTAHTPQVMERVKQRLNLCARQSDQAGVPAYRTLLASVRTQNNIRQVRGHREAIDAELGLKFLNFSHNSAAMVLSGNDGVRLYDLTVKPLTSRPLPGRASAAWFCDGDRKLVQYTTYASPKLVDLTQSPPTTTTIPNHRGIQDGVTLAAQGSILVTDPHPMWGLAHLWDVRATPVRDLGTIAGFLAIDAQGSKVVSSTASQGPMLHDLTTQPVRATPFPEAAKQILHASFSADGSKVATLSSDRSARVWALADGGQSLALLLTPLGTFDSAGFSNNGMRLWARSTYRIGVWDLVHQPYTAMASSNCFFAGASVLSPDVGWLVRLVGGHVDLVRLANHAQRQVRLGADTELTFSAHGAFSCDSSRLIAACVGGIVRHWDLSQNPPVPTDLDAGGQEVTSAQFSPDATKIVAQRADGTVVLWNFSGFYSDIAASSGAMS